MLKDFKLKWWQALMYETAMVSFGIIIGLNFYGFLSRFELVFWLLFVIFGFYILKTFLDQQSNI